MILNGKVLHGKWYEQVLLAFQGTVEHFLQTLEDLELPSFKTSLLLCTLQIFEDILKDFSNTFSILSNLQKFLKIP